MIEHRLIEKLMPRIGRATEAARREGRIDPSLVEFALDFIRTYADKCHHGKEEDILFRELDRKALAPDHRAVMDELVEEHRAGRKAVGELREAVKAYREGDAAALATVIERLEWLAAFYPAHIEKEDKRFFLPVMDYFSPEEREALVEEGREFDRKFIHEVYRARLAEWA
jgi:hemerythrin-like domain-containing protein